MQTIATANGGSAGRLALPREMRRRSPSDLRIAVGIKHRQTFKGNYLNPALRDGLICLKAAFLRMIRTFAIL